MQPISKKHTETKKWNEVSDGSIYKITEMKKTPTTYGSAGTFQEKLSKELTGKPLPKFIKPDGL